MRVDLKRLLAVEVRLDDLTKIFPIVVTALAALIYGVLILAYSHFYSELGVRPTEVGLEIGPGLAGLAGVAILAIALFLLGLLLVVVGRLFWELPPRTGLIVPLIIVGLGLAVFSVVLLALANDRADSAKNGHAVTPLGIGPLEIVGFRADRASVQLADPKGEESEAYRALGGRDDLLYLGRSASTLVVYDPKEGEQVSWQLPAGIFAVRAVNCETRLVGKDEGCD